jgi:hypothetical protein
LTETQNSWALAGLSAVIAATAWLFKRWIGVLMELLATKVELKNMEERLKETDHEQDFAMEQRIRAEQLRLHQENQGMFHEIRDDVKVLLGRRPLR